MRRQTDTWFQYNGTYDYEHGAKMIARPVRYAPALKGKAKDVSGRNGSLYVTDGCYDDVEVTLEFAVPEVTDAPDVNAWLTGTGLLRFSDEPDLAYEARIVKSFKREAIAPRLSGLRYTVTFSCQPFRLLYPEAEAVAFTAAGVIRNPGNAPARPRVTIVGSGDFSVTIGAQILYFTGVEGGIVVDSDLMDALTLDGLNLANDKVSGTPWTIPPGANDVSWNVEEGSVTSVTILPRWRFL